MKPIIARDQVALGPARCLGLALSGMSYRMFRSSVTIAILSLAVAFLVHMLTYGLVAHEAQLSAYSELERTRSLGQQITRLNTADPQPVISRELSENDAARIEEYRVWSGAATGEFERARSAALKLKQAAKYLDELPLAAHAVIVGDFTPEELFERLADPSRFKTFGRQLSELKLAPPFGSLQTFEQLVVSERPVLIGVIEAIHAGHAHAIEAVRRQFVGRTPANLAAAPPPEFASTLQAAGFSFKPADQPALTVFAQRQLDLQAMNRLILVPDTRAKIAREADIELGEVNFDSVMNYVEGSRRHAAWLSDVLRVAKGPPQLTAVRVLELSDAYVREHELGKSLGNEVPEAASGLLGMPERSRWLIALSFLVCVVGVANAMLMSVTERFTEIATMKCLGAMDGFVMLMFVFEAVIQGLIGGAIGLVLGAILALLRGLIEFGALIGGASGALGEVGFGMLIALVVGMALAAFAAVGPSWIAARLAPMEAMRVD